MRETLSYPLLLAAIALLAIVTFFDIATTREIDLDVLYLGPILLIGWLGNARTCGLTAALAVLAWLYTQSWELIPYENPLSLYWSTLTHLLSFLAFAIIVSRWREAYLKVEQLSYTDGLTGTSNSRQFHEYAAREMERCRRYGRPLSTAFVDLDNFKTVNDTRGHNEGDLVLKTVAGIMLNSIRGTDIVARLGGDEFVLILTETDAPQAKTGIDRLRGTLLAEMHERDWPVTFSIGVVTFVRPPESVEEILHRADECMYKVKNEKKDGVRYEVVENE